MAFSYPTHAEASNLKTLVTAPTSAVLCSNGFNPARAPDPNSLGSHPKFCLSLAKLLLTVFTSRGCPAPKKPPASLREPRGP